MLFDQVAMKPGFYMPMAQPIPQGGRVIGSSREFILHFRACSIVGCDPPALSWPTRVTHKENIDKEKKGQRATRSEQTQSNTLHLAKFAQFSSIAQTEI